MDGPAGQEQPSAVDAGPPAGAQPRVPWGIGDIAKAIGLVVLAIAAVSVPAALIAAAVAGGGADIDEDAGALTIVFVASLILEVVILLAALRFSLRKYGASWADLGLRRPARGGLWLAFPLVIGGLAIIYVYFGVLEVAGADPDSSVPEEAFDSVAPAVLLGVLSLAFAPAIEELFFRGFVFSGLRGRIGTLWAALASGLLFGLAHLGGPGTAYLVPPIAAVGAVFALGYAYSGSLLAAVLAHFLFNLVSFVVGVAA